MNKLRNLLEVDLRVEIFVKVETIIFLDVWVFGHGLRTVAYALMLLLINFTQMFQLHCT